MNEDGEVLQDSTSWRDIITRLSVAVMKKYEEEERKRLEELLLFIWI